MEDLISVGDQNTQQIRQNPISQAVPTTEKPKVNYLVIGAVILGCFVIIGFGGYYFLVINPFNTINKSVTKAETSNGNLIFVDNNKTFTFQYLEGSKGIKSSDPTPIGGTSFQAVYDNIQGDGAWILQVVTSPLDKNKSQNAQLLESKQGVQRSYKRVEDFSVNGEPAIMYFHDDGSGRNVEFGHNGVWYSWGLGGGGISKEDDEQIDKAFNLMVSSFKFLN